MSLTRLGLIVNRALLSSVVHRTVFSPVLPAPKGITLQKIWPILPPPTKSLSNLAHSHRMFDQSLPLQQEVWPNNPDLTKFDQSHPLQQEVWPIHPPSTDNFINSTHSRRKCNQSSRSCWKFEQSWPFWFVVIIMVWTCLWYVINNLVGFHSFNFSNCLIPG